VSAAAPSILFSAGEVSGDIVGAQLARALLRRAPSARLYGLGGPRMAEAGVVLTDPVTQVGVVGLTEVVAAVPEALRATRRVRAQVRREPPDVAVLIGNDLFNAWLGRWLRRRGVPTVAFFPPQVWVWESVLRPLARGISRVLAAFPDEARAYQLAGVPTTFVGHHLADALVEATPEVRAAARRALQLDAAAPVLALLPGSRGHEVRRIAPVLLEAARTLRRGLPGLRVVVAAADGFEAALRRELAAGDADVLVTRDSHTALAAADAAACCSGTATLEAALIGVPMVVVYRTSWTTYAAIKTAIALGVLRDRTIALPNLVLERPLIVELKQRRMTAPAVAAEVAPLLTDRARGDAMRQALRDVRRRVSGPGTIERVAGILLDEHRDGA
jgi:lipid-A-disaccharide synthase